MEKYIYELRPLFFLSIALYAVAQWDRNTLMGVSGAVLLVAVLSILYARYSYRHTH
ncbi:MAG TPA: hypothetical protein VFV50_19235 [Bdellovibrionales bacterium]|nr:hypothetical protein [Bdellovibrionales bacterium]